MPTRIRVGLVDHHEIVRRGLRVLLNEYESVTVVGEANCFQSARQLCDVHSPHVIVTDFLKPDVVGLHLVHRLRMEYPHIKFMLLTNCDNKSIINEALKLGVLGYWFKDVSVPELVKAIRSVYNGQPSLAPEVVRSVLHTLAEPPKVAYDLTDREHEVLMWMVKGYSNREIAGVLCISYSTVKNHVSNVLSKLGVSNRVEATTMALENNLVSLAQTQH